jgi:AraC-like DNA-binding protein
LRQRLLRCRDTIAGATGTGRSVIDIAFGWGFNSMATFYRAFVNEFGSSPGVLRPTSPTTSERSGTGEEEAS